MFRSIVLALSAAATFGLVGAVRLGAPADAAPPTTTTPACLPFACDPPAAPPVDTPPPCSLFDCPVPTTTIPPHAPQHFFIPEHYSAPFNAQPGDTVTVIMDPLVPFISDRCAAMGGALNADAVTVQNVYYCDGVDF